MLSAVAVFWGAGFVLNKELLNLSFNDTPALLNALRFGISALCLLAVFNKKIRFNKKILLYGGVGGILLFAGFSTQLIGLKYTTPSHGGFFTASYVVMVPFIAWIAYRRRPHWVVFVGTALAIGGLVLLNFTNSEQTSSSWIGDLLTIAGALCFALQIVWADFVLKKNKTDYVQLTFWQVVTAAVLFILYTVIFESRNYAAMHFDVGPNLWRLAIVVLGGTAFAYYAQTYAQLHLSPSETSIIMSCESPIGTFLSMVMGLEAVLWQTIVGGCMVIVAVIIVEVVPCLHFKRKTATSQVPTVQDVAATIAPPDDNTHDNDTPDQSNDTPDQYEDTRDHDDATPDHSENVSDHDNTTSDNARNE